MFVADLFEIPLRDNAVDVVYTSHAIEPNGGHEKEILRELYRVAKKYLVLFEPGYEFASAEGKARMERHGYIKDLPGAAMSLGYTVLESRMLDFATNTLNPTSVLIIEKNETPQSTGLIFQCPVTGTGLENRGEAYFSPEAYLMYPVIRNIPCLLGAHAILGSKYGNF